jgi:hypothetical protein
MVRDSTKTHKENLLSKPMTRTLILAALLLMLAPSVRVTADPVGGQVFDGDDWVDGLVDLRSSDIRNTELVNIGITDSGLGVTIPEGAFRGLGPMDRLPVNTEQAWYRYHIQLLDFPARSTGKLPGLSGLYSETGRGCKPSRSGSPGWSARGLFGPEGSNGAPEGEIPIGFYLYHLDQPDLCGEAIYWDDSSLRPGRWHCIEGYVGLNTLGKRDGVVMGWLDGTERFSRDGLAFRRPDESGVDIREMWLDIYYGGKKPTNYQLNLTIDEVEVSTSGRIGCLDDATNMVGAFEGDGDAIATYNPGTGSLMMNRSSGTSFAPLSLTTFRPGDNWSTHLVGDFTADGRDDIASYHPSNGTWWVSGRGETGFETARWGTFTPWTGWGPHLVGDFTGNGFDEVASYHPSNGTWWLSRPVGSVTPAERAARLEWANSLGARQREGTAMVDQILDEVAEFPVPPNDSFTTGLWGSYATTRGWSDQLVGDFNGDGRDDIASFYPASGSLWVNLSTGDGFEAERWGRFSPGTGWSNHVAGDFNGDGIDDVASYHGDNGTWWVSISTGDGFATSLWATFNPPNGWGSQLAGDFNGDGLSDIASFHSGNGTWWVSISDGTTFTTKRWATFNPTSGWGSQLAGDFNGDGITDIANFHLGNSTWWVGLSTGSSFATSRWDG